MAGSKVAEVKDQGKEELRRLRIKALRRQVKEVTPPVPDVTLAPPSKIVAASKEVEVRKRQAVEMTPSVPEIFKAKPATTAATP